MAFLKEGISKFPLIVEATGGIDAIHMEKGRGKMSKTTVPVASVPYRQVFRQPRCQVWGPRIKEISSAPSTHRSGNESGYLYFTRIAS